MPLLGFMKFIHIMKTFSPPPLSAHRTSRGTLVHFTAGYIKRGKTYSDSDVSV